MENNKLWFKAKRFGYGWYPATWQGWGVLGLFIISVIGFSLEASHLETTKEIVFAFIPYGVNIIFLIIICYVKGEKAKWRWGK